MREGWVETTLGEVAQVVGGGTPSTAVPAYWGGDVPWLTPSEVTAQEGQVITKTARGITHLGLQKSGARLLPPRTVLLTSRATIGAVALAGRSLATNQGFASLVPDGSRVVAEFLMYWCQHNAGEFTRRAGGNTFKEISKSKVAKVPILLPPLEGQRRIVDLIASVDRAASLAEVSIASAGRALTILREGYAARFSNRLRVLGEVVEIAAPLVDPKPAERRALPHIGVAQMRSGTGELGEWQTVGAEGVVSAKFLFEAEDVVFSKIRPNLRKVCLPGFRGLCSADAYPLRPRAGIVAEYLLEVLLSEDFTRTAVARSGRTKMPKINRGDLMSIRVPVPSEAEQTEAAGVMLAVRGRLRAAEATAVHLAAVKVALLNSLLSGAHTIPASYDRFLEGVA
jgi:hypothetical protein